jgi:hypothetical protein
MNGTEQAQRFRIASRARGRDARRRADVELAPTEARWVPLAVQLPPDARATLGPARIRCACASACSRRRAGGRRRRRQPLAERREKSTFVVPR